MLLLVMVMVVVVVVGGGGVRWVPSRALAVIFNRYGGDTHLRIKLTGRIIRSKIELALILVVCHLSKRHNSVGNRNCYDSFSLHIVKLSCLFVQNC